MFKSIKCSFSCLKGVVLEDIWAFRALALQGLVLGVKGWLKGLFRACKGFSYSGQLFFAVSEVRLWNI